MAGLPNSPTAQIVGLQFYVMSPDDIKKQSVVEVTESSLYVKNVPTPNGPNDHRMGTIDRRYSCGTCGQDANVCQGHIGHVQLAAPVYHVGFIPFILRILRVTCFFCSRVTLDASSAKVSKILETTSGEARFVALTSLHKDLRQCPYCEAYNPHYSQESLRLVANWTDAIEYLEPEVAEAVRHRVFTASDAHDILSGMTEDDYRLLGLDPNFNRPQDMIMSVMVVPPNATRPVVMQSDYSRAKSQDDLTKRIQEIVKANRVLAEAIKAYNEANRPEVDHVLGMSGIVDRDKEATVKVLEAHETLQNLYGTMVYTRCKGVTPPTSRGGRQPKSIQLRIGGKAGRVRNNTIGKRVNNTGRTVIVAGYAAHDIDTIGIPMEMALEMTMSVRVNGMNRIAMQQKVVNGPGRIDGALYIKTSSGETINLKMLDEKLRRAIYLGDGWIVDIPLQENAIVIMNRQPTLHRHGMMGHRARILKDEKSARLHTATCKSYNADFDGDEMNMHCLQSLEARAEAECVLSVEENMLSSKDNKPIMGCIQDIVLGALRMTNKNTLFSREAVMQFVMQIHYWRCEEGQASWIDSFKLPPPAIVKPANLWTGKQVFSFIMPNGLCLDKAVRDGEYGNVMDLSERFVCIRDGWLLSGSLCNQTVGATGGSIVHVIAKDNSKRHAVRFLSDARRVLDAYLLSAGASVGISDCIPTRKIREGVQGILQRTQRKLSVFEECVKRGDLADASKEEIEAAKTSLTSQVLDLAGRIVMGDVDSKTNSLKAMVESGAKGKPINLAQIMGVVGQQKVEGARLHPKTHDADAAVHRTDAEALGLVCRSYYEGLSPSEFFHHAQGGREGLTDTAIKTAKIGYTQRKLETGCRGLIVTADGSIKNMQGESVTYAYGGDGMEAAYLERVTGVWTISASDASILQAFTEAEASRIIPLRDAIRRERIGHTLRPEVDWVIFSPVHFERLWNSSKFLFKSEGLGGCFDESFEDRVLSMVDSVCQWISTHTHHYVMHPTGVLLAIRTLFGARVIGNARTMNATDGEILARLDYTFEKVRRSFDRCRVVSGEVVGSLAAESIGEPCTQMTLNTFHLSGVGSTNVSLGVPRLVEIIDCSRSIATPSMIIAATNNSLSFVESVRRRLIELRLSDVVTSCTVVPENSANCDALESAAIKVGALFRLPTLSKPSAHAIRLVLNRARLEAHACTPHDVSRRIREETSGVASVTCTGTPCDNWILRIRLLDVQSMAERLPGGLGLHMAADKDICTHVAKKIVSSIMLCGIRGIKGATIVSMNAVRINAATGALETYKEHRIITSGSSILEASLVDGVDPRRIATNDISEVRSVFGIEAAVYSVFDELKKVMVSDGGYVDNRHMSLIADAMCVKGNVVPMNRFGIRANSAPIASAAFEETLKIMNNAAVFGKFDPLQGVMERVFIGSRAPIGTGTVTLLESEAPVHRDPNRGLNAPVRQRLIYRSAITEWGNADCSLQLNMDNLQGPSGVPTCSDDLDFEFCEPPPSINYFENPYDFNQPTSEPGEIIDCDQDDGEFRPSTPNMDDYTDSMPDNHSFIIGNSRVTLNDLSSLANLVRKPVPDAIADDNDDVPM